MDWTFIASKLWDVPISPGSDATVPIRTYHGSLPPTKPHPLLLLMEPLSNTVPRHAAVGYFRYAGGDPDSPAFTIPGLGGVVLAWADCIEDFPPTILAANTKPEDL